MKHKNDLKINIENKPKKVKGDNIFKRIIIVLILILLCVFILNKAKNYIIEKTANEMNLIINNRNVTEDLKHPIINENGIIYVSMDDIENYFDKYIHIEEDIN